jgi:hypothetical protein
MARNPWKKLMANVYLSAERHGGDGLGVKDEQWLASRKRVVSITWQDLLFQFNSQEGKCYWFGIPLHPDDIFKVSYPLSMSVDRLDNTLGYEKDNIVVCSRLANLGRCNCSAENYKDVVHKLINPKTNKWIIYTD